MKKKNRQKFQQLLAKRQLVSQLSTGQATATELPANSPDRQVIPGVERVTPEVQSIAPAEFKPSGSHHLGGEIGRTVMSVAAIAGILLAAVIVDRRSNIFNDWGDQIYSFLRLNT